LSLARLSSTFSLRRVWNFKCHFEWHSSQNDSHRNRTKNVLWQFQHFCEHIDQLWCQNAEPSGESWKN
jgi:hypothetical protein